jgi:hypothetical protein
MPNNKRPNKNFDSNKNKKPKSDDSGSSSSDDSCDSNDSNNNLNNNPLPPVLHFPPIPIFHLINIINNKNNDNNDNDNDNDNDNNQNNQGDDICKNPKCDHMDFTSRQKMLGMDKLDNLDSIPEIEFRNIDDLIEMGYRYHCKKRTIYRGIDLKILFNLIEPLLELKKLVGMTSVKESMVDQILFFLQKLNRKEKCNNCVNCDSNLKFNTQNKCLNVIENDDMLHTIISGPPGVGKTELGKILGKVYKSMGVLTKGHFNIARRSDLIAKYLGQTAPKTQGFIDKCKGGVMFIDEAYSLGNPEGRDSFAKECLDTLNQNLSERRDFLCIIAGYDDALEQSFFSFNDGLKRRFSFKYNIDEYSGEELADIFLLKVNKEDWEYIESHEELKEFFIKNKKSFPRFGGDIETLFLKSKIMHSRRVIFKDESLRKKITLEDVKKGFDNFSHHRKKKEEELPENIMTMYT